MMHFDEPVWVYAIGLSASALFSARILVQWIASERAKKILSPALFWKISLAASFFFCIYGWLRNDFSIIAAQLVSYYIYIWNVNAKGEWKTINKYLRAVIITIPIAAFIWCVADWKETVDHLFRQDNLPVWMIVYGTTGQFIFAFRFVYQWLYSRKKGESLLPIAFWIISLTGSLMIVSYGIMRDDFILILNHFAGIVSYSRNIMIGLKNRQFARED